MKSEIIPTCSIGTVKLEPNVGSLNGFIYQMILAWRTFHCDVEGTFNDRFLYLDKYMEEEGLADYLWKQYIAQEPKKWTYNDLPKTTVENGCNISLW